MTTLRDSPVGNVPTARLEVPTWAYEDEPPAAVDAGRDRTADRVFTAARTLFWASGVVLVGAVLAALLNSAVLPVPVVLVTGGVLLLAAARGAGVWHQQLRRRTGVPVLPICEEILAPFARSMRSWRQACELALEERSADDAGEDVPNLREFQESARVALHAHQQSTRQLTRQLARHGELAAQADRRGWRWLRDRHVRTIAALVLQAMPEQSDTDRADAARTDASSHEEPRRTDQPQTDT